MADEIKVLVETLKAMRDAHRDHLPPNLSSLQERLKAMTREIESAAGAMTVEEPDRVAERIDELLAEIGKIGDAMQEGRRSVVTRLAALGGLANGTPD